MKITDIEVIPQILPDILLIKPKAYKDQRGYFAETYIKKNYDIILKDKINFIQDNESMSKKNVLRGLHYQIPPYEQSKLIKIIKGEILDICVDIRIKSKTFGKYVAIKMSSTRLEQLYIPKGFAHGFLVLSNEVIFSYKVDNYYSPKHQRGINFNDPLISINWGTNRSKFIISEKDKLLPYIKNIKNIF